MGFRDVKYFHLLDDRGEARGKGLTLFYCRTTRVGKQGRHGLDRFSQIENRRFLPTVWFLGFGLFFFAFVNPGIFGFVEVLSFDVSNNRIYTRAVAARMARALTIREDDKKMSG